MLAVSSTGGTWKFLTGVLRRDPYLSCELFARLKRAQTDVPSTDDSIRPHWDTRTAFTTNRATGRLTAFAAAMADVSMVVVLPKRVGSSSNLNP